jgi:hypothetical protein
MACSSPTQKDIATHLGIKQPQVSRLVGRGMPTDSLEAAAAWHKAHVRLRARPELRKAQAAEKRAAADPYQVARTQREQIDVETARLALLERRKVLVHRDTVRAELARHLSTLRESLLQLPVRLQSVLAQEQDEAKVHDLLQDEVDLLLERISGVL